MLQIERFTVVENKKNLQIKVELSKYVTGLQKTLRGLEVETGSLFVVKFSLKW